MKPDLLLAFAPHGSKPRQAGLWARFLARVLASSLDHQLATGCLPRSSRALTVRAQQIVSPAGRQQLVQRWINVMDLAGRPPAPRSPRGPLCRSQVVAAKLDLWEMIAVLAGSSPVAARGAAMASWLLIDSTGPLHDRRSPLDLGAVAREVTRQMGSFADSPADGADPDNAECYQ